MRGHHTVPRSFGRAHARAGWRPHWRRAPGVVRGSLFAALGLLLLAVVPVTVAGRARATPAALREPNVPAAPGLGAPSITLGRAAHLPTGGGGRAILSADFNGDGHLDLAVAHSTEDTVAILAGDGRGGFGAPVLVATGRDPVALAAVPTRDGAPDLVVAEAGEDAVLLLRNDGRGGFTRGPTFATGALPSALAVADLDGDGFPDVVAADANSGDITVLMSDERGSFLAPARYAAGTSPRALAIADVNEDGMLDVLVAGVGDSSADQGALSVLLGTGSGAFPRAVTYRLAAEPQGLAAADLNGDGHIDLVVSSLDGHVSTVLGLGDGRFRVGVTLGTGGSAGALVVADLNGDAWPDIAAVNSARDAVSIFLGRGDGQFEPARAFPAGLGAEALAQGDFGAGVTLAIADFNEDAVTLLDRPMPNAPAIQMRFSGPASAEADADQVFVSPATAITLAATGSTSVLARLRYQISMPPTPQEAPARVAAAGPASLGASFALSGLPEGSYVVRSQLMDAAGGVLASRTVKLRLDATPPTVALDLPGVDMSDPRAAMVPAGTRLRLTATDTGAGVATLAYRVFPVGTKPPAYTVVAGGEALVPLAGAPAEYVIEYYAVDRVGNGGPRLAQRQPLTQVLPRTLGQLATLLAARGLPANTEGPARTGSG